MANTSNEQNGLKGRVAAEKLAANAKKVAQRKTVAAWAIAKTMLPDAPFEEQKKFAATLMANSLTTLKVATRQTAVNAHYTRVAEQFAAVHKVEMNDLLAPESELTKEEKAVLSELKGDPKSAGAKAADDRKDAGPLPAEYPDPKRTEPAPLDGSNAAKGRPDSWSEGPGSGEGVKKDAATKHKKDCDCAECKKEAKKKASVKTACGEGCDGDCEHKKEASAKKASAKKAAEGEETPADDTAGDADAAQGDAEFAEHEAGDAADAAGDAADDAAGADEDAADAAGDAGDEEGEEFDPAKANLEEAAADLEHDIDQLQDAIADLGDEPGDITFDGEDGDAEGTGEDVELNDLFATGDEGGEGEPTDGEELNLDDIFDEGNMSDKVSSLNDEGADGVDEFIVDLNGDDNFFGPSDPSELEAMLEEEDKIEDPYAMFAVEASIDPMAALFGKTAQTADVIKPGQIADALETDLHGDDRDAESDHDGSIFEEVFRSFKQPTRDDHRQGETEPHMKAAGKGKPAKKQAGISKLRPRAGNKTATVASQNANLASLLFTDESDYL